MAANSIGDLQLPPMAGVDLNFLRELNARLLRIGNNIGNSAAAPAAAPNKSNVTTAGMAVAGIGQAPAPAPLGDTADPPVHHDGEIEDLGRMGSAIEQPRDYESELEDLRRQISALDVQVSPRAAAAPLVFLEDTLANLSGYPAASYALGSVFYASDTQAFYMDVAVSGTPTWTPLAGVVIEDTAANLHLYAAADYPAGSVFYVTDTAAVLLDLVVSGTPAWVTLTGAARASGSGAATLPVTLTTSWQDIPGCSVVLLNPGTYLILVNVEISAAAADGNCDVQVVSAAGPYYGGPWAVQNGVIEVWNGGGQGTVMASRQWLYTTANSLDGVKIQGICQLGPSGTSVISPANTNIVAVQIG